MKISVVTAVFNRHRTIGQAMRSVQGQKYGDIEHLIQDGLSTDGTLAEIKRYMNPATLVISEHDDGIYDAINKAIERSTGSIIGLMHSDDFFASDRALEMVAEKFETSSVDGVYGDLEYVSASEPTKVIRHWRAGDYSPKRISQGWMPPHPTLYLRREVFETWGGYDTSFSIAADYEAVLRWLCLGHIRLAYVPEVIVRMRVGGASNRSLSHVMRKSWEDYRAIRRHRIGGLGTLARKNVSKIGQFLKPVQGRLKSG